ncbi:uncharacterized protein LOC131004856 isoform X2 [Salvia miltiorrhiza]|uniref:uncharacterized protein LOC131004856 isoform X2 n=1 Tax=Salvia miltiorrhiza TaxID=226208 RepID=UPI0025AB6A5F|nr:uncharacterized protein LOC131004856 isoform X2 [Salvia miltiorrhiza]
MAMNQDSLIIVEAAAQLDDGLEGEMENAYGSIAQQKNDGGITMLENLQGMDVTSFQDAVEHSVGNKCSRDKVMGSDDLCSLPTHHDEIPLADNIEEINTIDIERGVVHSDGDQPPKEKVGASRNAENEVKLLLYWP